MNNMNIKYVQNKLANNVPIQPISKTNNQNLINRNKSEIEKTNERNSFKSIFQKELLKHKN